MRCDTNSHAAVAELADALDLGSSVPDVKVQVLSAAPPKTLIGFPYKCFVVDGINLCSYLNLIYSTVLTILFISPYESATIVWLWLSVTCHSATRT